jgi:hypothetical protein
MQSNHEHAANVVSVCGAAIAGCSGVAGKWLVENHELLASIGVCVGIVGWLSGIVINIAAKVAQHRAYKRALIKACRVAD